MGKKKWTYDSLLTEAKKYSFKKEFQDGSTGAYIKARRLGILDDICIHMPSRKDRKRKWSIETVTIEALKYTSRSEFQKENGSAYRAARQLEILEDVCSHMIEVRHQWGDNELYLEALKYTVRGDFQYYSKGAYMAAFKRGLLKKICMHMKYQSSATKLTDPMYLYFIKITTLNGALPDVYKVGITKYSDIMRRFKREYSVFETKIDIIKTWYFDTGYKAAEAERNVMEIYKEFKYKGISPLRDTKTSEMFTENILALEEV